MKFLHKAKKSLGQNFLNDKNIINKIVEIGKIKKHDSVMEIGPGYGNLTEIILNNNPQKIIAIEKDSNLCKFLTKNFKIKYTAKCLKYPIVFSKTVRSSSPFILPK